MSNNEYQVEMIKVPVALNEEARVSYEDLK